MEKYATTPLGGKDSYEDCRAEDELDMIYFLRVAIGEGCKGKLRHPLRQNKLA